MTLLRALYPFYPSPAKPEPGTPDAHELDRLRTAVASASAEVRYALFYYGAFGLYFAITVASTTHEGLLRGSLVIMPLLGIGMPAKGFFAFVPLLLIILHIWVWLQLLILARCIRALNDLQTSTAATTKSQFLLTSPFVVTQWFFGQPPGFFLQLLLWLSGSIVLVIAPIGVLIGTQIRFLPYHSAEITWIQRGYVMIDFLITVYFTFRIVPSGGTRLIWRTLGGLGLLILLLAAATASLVVATVPDELWERSLVKLVEDPKQSCESPRGAAPAGRAGADAKQACDSPRDAAPARGACAAAVGWSWLQPCMVNGRAMWGLTYLLFEAPETPLGLRRNIVVRGGNFVESKPPEELLSKGVGEAWREAGSGVDLRGRNLRFADLSGSDLRRADFRGADLEGAIFRDAKLLAARIGDIPREELTECLPGLDTTDGEGKPFCRTRMAGIDLSRADLGFIEGWKADLRSANLTGANLESAVLNNSTLIGAVLQWAKLPEAKLWGADLRGAVMLGVEAARADLTCADLEGASLKDAKLRESGLAGAVIEAADLRGSNVDAASFGDAVCDPETDAPPQSASLHGADLRGIKPAPGFTNRSALTALLHAVDWVARDRLPLLTASSTENRLLYEVRLARQLTQLACRQENARGNRNQRAQDGQAAGLNELRQALSRGIAQRILIEYRHADDQTPGDVRVRDADFMVAGALLFGRCEAGDAAARMNLRDALSETESRGLERLRCLWFSRAVNPPGARQTLLDNWDKNDDRRHDDVLRPVLEQDLVAEQERCERTDD